MKKCPDKLNLNVRYLQSISSGEPERKVQKCLDKQDRELNKHYGSWISCCYLSYKKKARTKSVYFYSQKSSLESNVRDLNEKCEVELKSIEELRSQINNREQSVQVGFIMNTHRMHIE